MKTAVIIFVAILFVITLYCYFTKGCNSGECGEGESRDSRADAIRRAKQNLHPTLNKGVERCSVTGRYISKS